MGSTVKRGDVVRHKTDYQSWQRFRANVAVLREQHSWKEMSRLFEMDNEGWAQAAYNHRGLVSDAHVARSEELVARHREQHPDPAQADAAALSREARAEAFISLVEEAMAGPYELDFDDLALGTSYTVGSSIQNALRNARSGKPPGRKWFQSVQDFVINELRSGALLARRAEAEAKEAASRPPKTEEAPPPAEEAEEAKQAEEAPPAPAAAPPADPWDWMPRVQEKLLEAAAEVSDAKRGLPSMFHAAMDAKQRLIEDLMDEFDPQR